MKRKGKSGAGACGRYIPPPLWVAICLLLQVVVVCFPSVSLAVELEEPRVKIEGDRIFVESALRLDDEMRAKIEKGIEKEFIFRLDLVESIALWPDDYVIGRKLIRTVHCDPVKKEFVATSSDGNERVERRFEACEPLLRWALRINELMLINTSALESGRYYVHAGVESRIRDLPPIISQVFFFVREREFALDATSPVFDIGPREPPPAESQP